MPVTHSDPGAGKRASYGLDAPVVVRNLGLAAVGCFAVGAFFPKVRWMISPGIGFSIGAGLMIWASLFGKVLVRNRILRWRKWRGDEQVLDIGCGRGLYLLGAAKQLTTGRAVGIDLWQAYDLSGNTADATWANARAEGVEDRIEIMTGDMRKMPFPDASFDVILSSQAIHNIYDRGEREAALDEIVRVLKAGGSLYIIDHRNTGQYADFFRREVFPPSPVVLATKP
jgi:arsenite methyltransferase